MDSYLELVRSTDPALIIMATVGLLLIISARRKLLNLLSHGKWTNCRHEHWDSLGWDDFECRDCGAHRVG